MWDWDDTWNCQGGRLSNGDPDLSGRYDPWDDEEE